MTTGPFGSGSFGTGVFANSPFYNTKKLIDSILRDTGHSNPAQETSKRERVLTAINNRYALVSTLQHWNWLYQELDFNLEGPYTTGTVIMTPNSETVGGIGTVFSSNVVPNNILSLEARNETYLIETVNSSDELVLEGRYAGDTASDSMTGDSYKIIKPIYTLPSDCEAVQSIVIDGVGEVVLVGTQEFTRYQRAFPGLIGPPKIATEVGRRQQDGVRLVQFYPAPDKNYISRLHYGVNIMSLTDEESSYPLIPDRHRVVLYYGGLADFYVFLRDSKMSDTAELKYEKALMGMRNDKQLTDSKVVFQPARNYRNRLAGRRRRISYSISDFAKLED